MSINKETIREIISQGIKSRQELARIKRKMAKKHEDSCPSNIELLKVYREMLQNQSIQKNSRVEKLLQVKPTRSLSGITNVAVLTKPHPCPGQCVFCPVEKGLPKSYLSGEPAVERAKALEFDPFLQTKKRIEMLQKQGHPTEKIELRLLGGTFSFYPQDYQEWFIKRCFDACNLHNSESLEQAQSDNQKAKHRLVGISIETRPDFVTEQEVMHLRKLGVTLVEMGVQTVFDDVLKECKTGLTSQKIAEATKLLKDAGFKILYQTMPNLPGSTPQKDISLFERLIKDHRFRPDWLKIYPCLVCKNTPLYEWWQKGEYQPYTKKELIELLTEAKKKIPYWVRITRIFRDIPAQKIEAGCQTSNLREEIQEEMEETGEICRCIRCREVRGGYEPEEKIYLFREDYSASGGKEIFLSFENQERNKLLSYLRLRVPSFFSKEQLNNKAGKHFIPALQDSTIIREIQTFGPQIPVAKQKIAPQHKGLGKQLIKQAEVITKKEFGLSRIAAISGVGVREYWKKMGYQLNQTYMVKEIE